MRVKILASIAVISAFAQTPAVQNEETKKDIATLTKECEELKNGSSCYKAAVANEQIKKRKTALELYNKACEYGVSAGCGEYNLIVYDANITDEAEVK